MNDAGVSAVVLAGGKSTRLGRDKATALLAGKTMLQRVLDTCSEVAGRLIVVKARGQELPKVRVSLPVTVVEDEFPETGPLGGIYGGLSATETAYAIVVACDLPLLQPALLRALVEAAAGREAAVPVRAGLPEPLCAVYSRTAADAARRRLERGEYKVAGLYEDVDVVFVREAEWRGIDPEGLSFLNVNQEADLARAEALLAGEAR